MAAKKKPAKKPAPQLIPWQPQLQASADEYMHRMLRLIRQPGLHPAYLVANAAGLCALMGNPEVPVPHDEAPSADGPVRTPWDRQAVYEEAAQACPGALPWSKTAAANATPSE